MNTENLKKDAKDKDSSVSNDGPLSFADIRKFVSQQIKNIDGRYCKRHSNSVVKTSGCCLFSKKDND